ncbi:MAG: MerR family transcriptional regulator [Lactobacillaceae bacterium]|jgi:hypothetical protein|nr:MerR family transcriptional regulator [Lactobacillaceae bacterium]
MKYLYTKDYFKAGFNSDLYQFRIGEIEAMTGVSARQVRYWESKGIIEAIERASEQEGRVYRFKMLVKIAMIKHFLDEGFTLKTSVASTEEKQKYMSFTHKIVANALQGVVDNNGQVMLDMGDFDEDGKQRLLAYYDHEKVHYQVIDASELEEADE